LIFQGSAQERRPNCLPMVLSFLSVITLLHKSGKRDQKIARGKPWPTIQPFFIP
jgi:hypothetical protein